MVRIDAPHETEAYTDAPHEADETRAVEQLLGRAAPPYAVL
ncbi:hypothetical protein [Kitasatospora sp. NPDC088783]